MSCSLWQGLLLRQSPPSAMLQQFQTIAGPIEPIEESVLSEASDHCDTFEMQQFARQHARPLMAGHCTCRSCTCNQQHCSTRSSRRTAACLWCLPLSSENPARLRPPSSMTLPQASAAAANEGSPAMSAQQRLPGRYFVLSACSTRVGRYSIRIQPHTMSQNFFTACVLFWITLSKLCEHFQLQ